MNCSSHGTCSNTTGKCQCNAGFAGADCATQLVTLPTDGSAYQQSFQSFGYNWLYITLPSNPTQTPFTLTLSSSNSMDIFLSADQSIDPTGDEMADLELKQQSRFTLSSKNLPKYANGFLLAVRVNGANLFNNQYFKSQLNAQFVMDNKQVEEYTMLG